ncbi:MAG: nucleotidyltransferase domain-containing protein [Dehalococcoidia bacterium]|nr:nucleotidyltransferase domain-containing protein [Dehalococcoidia bacterium]
MAETIKNTPDQPIVGVLEQAVESLRRGLGEDLIAVVLFGSRARGDAHEDSDWDLLVIAEGLPDRLFERHIFLTRLLPPVRSGGFSILAKTPEEFEAHLPSLYLDIALDGQVLYDHRGYAVDRLSALQRLIKRVGLYRTRSEAGDVWRWQEEPSVPWKIEWEEPFAVK